MFLCNIDFSNVIYTKRLSYFVGLFFVFVKDLAFVHFVTFHFNSKQGARQTLGKEGPGSDSNPEKSIHFHSASQKFWQD